MRVVLIILLVVGLGAAVTGIASNAYQAGLMRGQTQSQAAPPQTGPPPYPSPYYYGPYWHPPFGFGFFGFLLPLLFIFFIFALLKGVMLWLYPLDQKRVDEVEQALMDRRVRSAGQAPVGSTT